MRDNELQKILDHYPTDTHSIALYLIRRNILCWPDLDDVHEQVEDCGAYLVMTLYDVIRQKLAHAMMCAVLKQQKPYFDFMQCPFEDVCDMISANEISADGDLCDALTFKLRECGVLNAKLEVVPTVMRAQSTWVRLFDNSLSRTSQ